MDIQDLFYTPQDIAKLMFEIDLGAKMQEPFISAVWLKEQAFIAPEWRKCTYKEFYQTVSRFFDGCVDVVDKKKDLAYLSKIHSDNPKINFSEKDYINDFSKLKFSFFKELRLKLLFFKAQVNYLFLFSVLASKTKYNLETLQQCLDFYRLEYTLSGNYCPSIKKLDDYEVVHISVMDGEGIYDDFVNLPKAEYEEDDEDEDDEDAEENDDVPFEYELLISVWDLIDFFKTKEIKQKGKNNQLQFIEFLCANYNEYLYTSNYYSLSYLIYEETKRWTNIFVSSENKKFSLLKYIKLSILRTNNFVYADFSKLLNDAKTDNMEVLKKYLDYYGLVCYVKGKKWNGEKLSQNQTVQIGDISFLEEKV